MDDYIIKEGEYGTDMFFVERGTCHVTRDETPGQVLGSKTTGDYFGEMGVLTSAKRSASVRRVSCSLVTSRERRREQTILVLVLWLNPYGLDSSCNLLQRSCDWKDVL